MQLSQTPWLGIALAASTLAAIPDQRGPEVPAQCAWNGYSKKTFQGTVTNSKSVVTVCNKITNPLLLNDLDSAKVTLGAAVCLYEGTTACTGTSITVNSKGNPNLSAYSFRYWKCGSCLAD